MGKPSWHLTYLAEKIQKLCNEWDIARINVITCKQAKTFFQCKKAENSVIKQKNAKNIILSEI